MLQDSDTEYRGTQGLNSAQGTKIRKALTAKAGLARCGFMSTEKLVY